MPPVTVKSRRLTVTADLPVAVSSKLARLRDGLGQILHRGGTSQSFGALELSDELPALNVVRHDPVGSLAFFGEPTTTDVGATLAEQVRDITWYHTLELPGGILTPGVYDQRKLVPHYGIPGDLAGKRVLDVATADGFWAFEFERRGAAVSAVNIARIAEHDFPPPVREALLRRGLDQPADAGFRLARSSLGSSVEPVLCSAYDLDPANLGTFDFVHVADLLLHLEHPLQALRAIRSVTRGQALIVDCIDPTLKAGETRYLGGWTACTWWLPALDTLAQMVIDAGFSTVEVKAVYRLAARDQVRGGYWRASLLAGT